MQYQEKQQDLFTVPDEYYLAHCISADFAMGAGIAVQFNRQFAMRDKLRAAYPHYLADWQAQGRCFDWLQWLEVSAIIQKLFADDDLEILICIK